MVLEGKTSKELTINADVIDVEVYEKGKNEKGIKRERREEEVRGD